MKYCIGRQNFALTVYVPYDCANNCRFCASKHIYKENGVYAPGVELSMNKVFSQYDFPIRDVVFTGGEPMADVESLQRLVSLVPENCNVYINTTLVKKDLWLFVELVNNDPKIKAINVSRHGGFFEDDQQELNGIAPDEAVSLFEKPVRINAVMSADKKTDYYDSRYVGGVVERWKKYPNVSVEFRADYRVPLSDSELHTPYASFPLTLYGCGFDFVNHSECNVCDSIVFAKANENMRVIYHRGLEKTSLYHADTDTLEINDLIIHPDGLLDYDWTETNRKIMYRIEKHFKRVKGEQRSDILSSLSANKPQTGNTDETDKQSHGASNEGFEVRRIGGGSCGGNCEYVAFRSGSCGGTEYVLVPARSCG